MKVMTLNDRAYRVLREYPYEQEYNINVYKNTGRYDVSMKNNKLQTFYFCERIADVEFEDITTSDLNPEVLKGS